MGPTTVETANHTGVLENSRLIIFILGACETPNFRNTFRRESVTFLSKNAYPVYIYSISLYIQFHFEFDEGANFRNFYFFSILIGFLTRIRV